MGIRIELAIASIFAIVWNEMFDFLDGFYLVLHSNYIYLNNPFKNETICSKKFLLSYTCKKLLEVEDRDFFSAFPIVTSYTLISVALNIFCPSASLSNVVSIDKYKKLGLL